MSDITRAREACRKRLDALIAKGPISKGYDLDDYRAGEIEGYMTCLRVLDDLPTDRTPAQAIYTLAGFRADRSTKPKDRSLYDRERGFMDSRDASSWNLAWNRVIWRVQGWLEVTYGFAEYENSKDLSMPPLPYLDQTDPDYQKDMDDSTNAMLGRK